MLNNLILHIRCFTTYNHKPFLAEVWENESKVVEDVYPYYTDVFSFNPVNNPMNIISFYIGVIDDHSAFSSICHRII